MNIIDLTLALGLFWFVRMGWQVGLIQSLGILISLMLAYGCALAYGESAARAVFGSTEDLSGGVALFGFIAVFAAVLLACYLVGRFLCSVLRASPLGAIDAFGGGALGLAQGILIVGLFTVFMRANPIHSRAPELIDQSALGPRLQKAAHVIADRVQALFPKAKTLLEKLGLQVSDTPPLIEKLNKEAREAQKKINELLDESQKSK